MLTLLQDASGYPHAFEWNGAMPAPSIEKWRHDGGWIVPPELIELWATTGGGDLFESETVLQPGRGAGIDGGIDEENEALSSTGLPFNLLVFHRGMCISAIDQASGEIVTLEPVAYLEAGRFASFEDWYVMAIRDEFAVRYGLRRL